MNIFLIFSCKANVPKRIITKEPQFYDMAPPNWSRQELVAQIVSPEDMCRESPSDGRLAFLHKAFHNIFYISRYHTI